MEGLLDRYLHYALVVGKGERGRGLESAKSGTPVCLYVYVCMCVCVRVCGWWEGGESSRKSVYILYNTCASGLRKLVP